MIQLDEIGVLYTTHVDEEMPTGTLPGYHVNSTYPVAEWTAYKVTPATPRRIFGGIPTYFYSFASQAEYESLPTKLDVTPPTVPRSVTIRQGCQALEEAGLLASIEAYISQAPRYVQIDWERATSIDRAWPTLGALKDAMGLTDEQIDTLFVKAATL